MKKLLAVVAVIGVLAVCVSEALAAGGCRWGAACARQDACCRYADEDGDGQCDWCDWRDWWDQYGQYVCQGATDEDGDGRCDQCGQCDWCGQYGGWQHTGSGLGQGNQNGHGGRGGCRR